MAHRRCSCCGSNLLSSPSSFRSPPSLRTTSRLILLSAVLSSTTFLLRGGGGGSFSLPASFCTCWAAPPRRRHPSSLFCFQLVALALVPQPPPARSFVLRGRSVTGTFRPRRTSKIMDLQEARITTMPRRSSRLKRAVAEKEEGEREEEKEASRMLLKKKSPSEAEKTDGALAAEAMALALEQLDEEGTEEVVSSSSSSTNGCSGSIKREDEVDAGDEEPPRKSQRRPRPSRRLLLETWLDHHDGRDDDADDGEEEDFHRFTAEEASEIRGALVDWYRSNRRMLPWRGDPPPWDGSTAAAAASGAGAASATSNSSGKNSGGKKRSEEGGANEKAKASSSAASGAFPVTAYGVWVSEVMLQQTRVETVVAYWCRWMTSFPTLAHLAEATEEQVNSHWAGLGYYRRARFLHEAAKKVVDEMDGQIPDTVEGLLELPGIGPYAAGAIASIAFGRVVPVVDGNVCRVLSRLRGIAQNIKSPAFKDKYAWKLALQIVEADGDGECPGEVNQALMELGATHCSPSGTGIHPDDPLREFYWSTRIGREFREVRDAAAAGGSRDHLRLYRQLQSLADGEEEAAAAGGAGACANRCAVCAPDGVSQVARSLFEAFEEYDDKEKPRGGGRSEEEQVAAASRFGHAAFPLAPPKALKREEVYAVGAICREGTRPEGDEEDMWLLVRRPKGGLLAGQFEFPSALVWSSENEKNKEKKGATASKAKAGTKRKSNGSTAERHEVPKVSRKARAKALDSLLNDLDPSVPTGSGGSRKRVGAGAQKHHLAAAKRVPVGDAHRPLEHVFSHVRHSMWIEFGTFEPPARDDDGTVPSPLEWTDQCGREVRWMRESDMEMVGVTSGVKKILKAVKQQQREQSKQDPPPPPASSASASAASKRQRQQRRK